MNLWDGHITEKYLKLIRLQNETEMKLSRFYQGKGLPFR